MPELPMMALHFTRIFQNPATERLREESGQSLVELALMLPSFFLLTFGLINLCMILFGINNLSFASRQAVRYACLHSATSTLPVDQAKIDSLVAPYVFKYPSNTYSDTVSPTGGSNLIGATATVKITITYKVVIPFFAVSSLPLTFTASGVIVQ